MEPSPLSVFAYTTPFWSRTGIKIFQTYVHHIVINMDENFDLSLPSSSYSSFNDSDITDVCFYWNDESKPDLERFVQFDEDAEGL